MKIRTLLGALVGLLLTQAAFAASTTLSLGTSTGPGGIVLLYGSTSGSVSLQTAAVAGTSTIFQLPATNGSNGNVLQTDGSGVTSWTSAGTGNCTVSSSAGAVFNNGSSACITNTDMTFATGILSLGINTSELGGVKMFGGTSGNVTIEPSAVAGTNLVATLPANTGTISEINLAETFTAAKTLTATAPQLILGVNTTTLGSVKMFGNTSGDLTIEPSAVAGTSSVATFPANTGTVAELNLAQSFTAPQRAPTETPTISTSTFTPIFSTGQHHRIVLTTACPCTLANPAAIVAGQTGMFEIVQSSTGSNTIGTWGSEYEYAGGTSTITLSTANNAVDFIPYYVDSTGSFIVLGGIIKGPAH